MTERGSAVREPAGWWRPVGAGVAVLLAGAPVGAVVEGGPWAGHAVAAVALVVAVGVVGEVVRPTRGRAAAGGRIVGVAAAQLIALVLAATATYSGAGVARVLPGPAAVADLAALLEAAATQVRTGVAPVPVTPALLLLVAGAFGLSAVVVHAVAVGARAPAVAGVLLLAVFAVPTALADDLLPAWMLVAAAAGFGLLLLSAPPAGAPAAPTRPGGLGSGAAGRRASVGVLVLVTAVVAALGVGAAASGIGTAGRFTGPGTGAGRAGEIGLSPFTSLRGQLEQGTPAELFRVTGLPRPTYLRALTLDSYVANTGWQASRPRPGTPLPGPVPGPDVPGDRARVTVENQGFRDYWLPVVGLPRGISDVPADRYAYDADAGTAYSTRTRRQDTWTLDAVLPAPSAAVLRTADADAAAGVGSAFLDTTGVDPRVAALAARVTADAPTGFDRAIALTAWFTGPRSEFRYDLSTGPGNGDDAMVEFLTGTRRGYCEQFASAMAAMLRTVGVPARVAVGFTGGRDDAGVRSVSTTDAHAWVEAWFPAAGWTTFDPTPLTDGRAVVPPYVAEALAESDGAPEAAEGPAAAPATAAPDTVAADPVTPDDRAPGDAAAAPTAAPGPAGDASADEPAATPALLTAFLALAGAGGVALLAAGPALLRARLRRRRRAAAAAGGPGAADAAWEELLATSADRDVPGRPSDTVRATARRLVGAHGLPPAPAGAVHTVADAVERSWYGGVDPEPGALTGPLRTALEGVAATPLLLRRRLVPPSLTGARAARPPTTASPDASGEPVAADGHRTDDAAATRR